MKDLTKEEFEWLVRLSRGITPLITIAVSNRLIDLGYAAQMLGGPGITEKGKARVLQGWR